MTCMQDKKKIEQKMRKEYPPLKTARELEWGFKIRYTVVSISWFGVFCMLKSLIFSWSRASCHICPCLGSGIDCCLLFCLCRDKTKPNSAFAPENLTILPGEKDLEPTLGEQVATWLRSFRK